MADSNYTVTEKTLVVTDKIPVVDGAGMKFTNPDDISLAGVDGIKFIAIAGGSGFLVRNSSGAGMVIGNVVYISGYNLGVDKPEVSLTDASAAATMPAIGIVAETIANNATGGICVTGRMEGVDTSAFTAGDSLYVSTTAGEWSTKPTGASDEVQKIGIVLRSHATLGVVEIVGAGRTNDIPNDGLLASLTYVTETGTTYTTTDEDNGKLIRCTNAATCTVTIHSTAAAGFNVAIRAKTAVQEVIAAGGTGTITNKDGHTKTDGTLNATVFVDVESNAGTAPLCILGGDTGA